VKSRKTFLISLCRGLLIRRGWIINDDAIWRKDISVCAVAHCPVEEASLGALRVRGHDRTLQGVDDVPAIPTHIVVRGRNFVRTRAVGVVVAAASATAAAVVVASGGGGGWRRRRMVAVDGGLPEG